MKFTDVFIKRPVVGIALSIIIVILGIFGLSKMNVSGYPEITQAAVKVQVNSVGTSAQSIQDYITNPLESNLAAINNLDYMESNSAQGSSEINLYFKAGTDVDSAFNDVVAAVNTAKKTLPSTVDDPIVTKSTALVIKPLYISYTSNALTSAQLVDYLDRHIKPQFYSVEGVANVTYYAPGLYLLITLDPEKIAKFHLSPNVVAKAIAANNLQISAGNLESTYRVLTNNVDGTVKSVSSLERLIVAHRGQQVIKLKDIAQVSLEAISGKVESTINGKQAVVMTFSLTPNSNPITVVDKLNKLYHNTIVKLLPNYIHSEIVYDGTIAVVNSIKHVGRTVGEAILIVMFVMLMFLGSLRSLIVPILAIPISIVANFIFLYSLGYTLNLITILAIILAIGLVVDDAIVVLENIHRHIKIGETPFRAAIIGTREIAMPVIVMTFTLAVVFMPIALSVGITGAIYKQFAITLAGAVVLSGFVSLTLSPMLVNKLYNNYDIHHVSKFETIIDNSLTKINQAYASSLTFFLQQKKSALAILMCVVASLIILPGNITSELTPIEDRGVIITFATPPANSTLDYANVEQKHILKQFDKIPSVDEVISVISPDQIINIAPLKDIKRPTQAQLVNYLNDNPIQVPGISFEAVNLPEIEVPGAGFYNFSVAIQSNDPYSKMIPRVQQMLNTLRDKKILSYGFLDVDYNKSKLNITIDRDKAAQFDVPIASVAQSLASYLSGGIAARISLDGKVYKVITKLSDQDKSGTDSLNNYYVQSLRGINIPLSELVTYQISSQTTSLPRLNQLNAVTIRGISNQAPGDLVKWLNNNFKDFYPSTYSYTFTGDIRNYIEEGNNTIILFSLAIILIFLVLAMKFNSWRDSLVIMITVPLAISGSLITLYIFNKLNYLGATFNLYTSIGLITLTGLITKHGILMCEVAKEEQLNNHLNKHDAIIVAARLRFRPILMTTLAMVAGLVPLLMSHGTGANANFSISLVIVSGLAIGTCFTLFILPIIYTWIGENHKPIPEFDETKKPLTDENVEHGE